MTHKILLAGVAATALLAACDKPSPPPTPVAEAPLPTDIGLAPATPEALPPAPPAPVAASFTGEWKHFFTRMTLEQTGEKVKGQLTSFGIAGAKLKGVVEGDELTAVVRGRGSHPTLGIGRFRIELNLTMNGTSILSGTSHAVFKGVDLGVHNETYTRVL